AAALDRRGVQRASPEKRMSFLVEDCRLEIVELGQNEGRVPDRVDSDVIAASVCRPAGKLELGPHEPAVRGTNCEPRRLRKDRHRSTDAALDELPHSNAR